MVSPPVVGVNDANDQSGSVEAAMTMTLSPSHSGACIGSLSSTTADAEAEGMLMSSAAWSSGPVTESKGLRLKMAIALSSRVCEAEPAVVGCREGGGMAARSFSSGARRKPMIWVTACA